MTQNFGYSVEIEGVVIAAVATLIGPCSIKIARGGWTETHEVSLNLALKAVRMNTAHVRCRFPLHGDGRMIDIEPSDVPAFDATRRYLLAQ